MVGDGQPGGTTGELASENRPPPIKTAAAFVGIMTLSYADTAS
jgi:hypothetical protein